MSERRNYWCGSTVILRTPNVDDINKIVADFDRRDYDSEAGSKGTDNALCVYERRLNI